ncbi:MAG: ABC transporter ATP-binding protein [Anaerolineae bacterium]|nr:ABC transporter ATP-binding protein [Anaerolineae bacterium]
MIEFQDVEKTYDTGGVPVHALNEVNLNVAEGEFVAVIGPSGSGKSTLLTVLGAMNPATSGQVLIDDIDIYALSTEQQADFRHEYIGFVFQQLQLLPYLTAQENVLLGLVIAKLRRADKISRAREVLERVGLKGKEGRLPYQLSGGEQGRVAVARAIVNEPPLILADEPTGNLDRATGKQVLDLLRDLNHAGHTVLMVSHDTQAAQVAGRVVSILDGQIIDDVTVPSAV